MKADQTTAVMMQYRADMYMFFSRLFILEVDEKLLAGMKHMKFPEVGVDTDFYTGYEMLKAWLEDHDAGDITDLEVDYARIFLAAGVAQGLAAFPYESVYTNKKHLMNQEASDDVTILYAAKGLEARKDMYRVPNDHISLEFEYMARLCKDAEAAANHGDETGVADSINEQKAFCRNHLKRWVTLFSNDVIKYARTDFYKAIGILCRGFIREEISFLA